MKSRSVLSLSLSLSLSLLSGLACTDKQSGDDEAADGTGSSGDSGDSSGESSSSGSTDTADTTSEVTEGNPFLMIPDGGTTNTCDPGAQDCPDGEKCTAYVMTPGYCCVDANKCVPIIGDKQLGDPCTRGLDNDDCDKGLFCMTKTSGDQGEGVCLAMCDAINQDCAEDGLPDADCIAFNDGALPLCQDSCDPVIQDCTPPLGCYGVGNQGFVCAQPGFDPGLGNDGDECYTVQSCKPGLGCTASEVLDGCGASRCCTPYCDLNEPDPCTAPESCVPYYDAGTAPPGYDHVGLCAIPA